MLYKLIHTSAEYTTFQRKIVQIWKPICKSMLKTCEKEKKFSEWKVSTFFYIDNRKENVLSEIIDLSYFVMSALPNKFRVNVHSVMTCPFIKNKYQTFCLNGNKKCPFDIAKNIASIMRWIELKMLPFLKKTEFVMIMNYTLSVIS